MSNRNRTVGNSLERKLFQLINRRTIATQQGEVLTEKELTSKDLEALPDSMFVILPKLGSTRKLSRSMDAQKKDLTPENMDRLREFPYILQAKSECKASIPYAKYLSEVKDSNNWGVPVIIHEQTKGIKSSTKHTDTGKAKITFKKQDDFAIMYRKDFIDMMFRIAELEFELKQKEHFEK